MVRSCSLAHIARMCKDIQDPWQTASPNTSSENICISTLFSKSIFTGYRTVGWQLFSSSTLKMLSHSFLASIILVDNPPVLQQLLSAQAKSLALWIRSFFPYTQMGKYLMGGKRLQNIR